MTEEVRERRYSTNLGNEEENCRCYCQKKRECERPEPKPASIFDYVYQELTWGQVRALFYKLLWYLCYIFMMVIRDHYQKTMIFTKKDAKRSIHSFEFRLKSNPLCYMVFYAAWIFLFHFSP